jgi:phosphoribosylformylglycinamidine cyclo-ligase
MAITYKDAGVDIDAGDALVERIKPLAAATLRPEVLGGLGGFAGLCRIPQGYTDPVLVSGTDGVGTKLKTAFATGRHDSVGIDLVAMCANDIAITGAEPLFFLDYFATGRLDVGVARDVIAGIADGCQQAGCALLGGETAELPGFYADGEYDLAGFCVGVVERGDIRDGSAVQAGDVVLGLPSSGLHSNGHSLARKVVTELLGLGWDDRPAQLHGSTVADEMIRPTRIYVRQLATLKATGIRFRAAAHITGGGLVENPPRVVPAHLAFRLDTATWEVPGIFRLIAEAGVEVDEMRRTFNMGLGMVVVVAAEDADAARAALPEARVVGDIVLRRGEPVEFR